jgi:hypothetical protein
MASNLGMASIKLVPIEAAGVKGIVSGGKPTG